MARLSRGSAGEEKGDHPSEEETMWILEMEKKYWVLKPWILGQVVSDELERREKLNHTGSRKPRTQVWTLSSGRFREVTPSDLHVKKNPSTCLAEKGLWGMWSWGHVQLSMRRPWWPAGGDTSGGEKKHLHLSYLGTKTGQHSCVCIDGQFYFSNEECGFQVVRRQELAWN